MSALVTSKVPTMTTIMRNARYAEDIPSWSSLEEQRLKGYVMEGQK
jgi:hypothetical protein